MARATRTFRIFVSSTFDDLKEERNALQRDCFPRLRELCAEHGTRFQAIDLRWGVPTEAGVDQRTMSICLDEIARCRDVSPRPNFVVLLGDRYGWRPLPETIEATEFETLLEALADEPRDHDMAAEWYARDENAVPPVYRLRPRTGAFEDDEAWGAVESRLRRALRWAAEETGLPPEARLEYEASATEQEIESGALRVDDAEEHVFCFFRSIEGLPDDEATFRDVDRGRADEEAAARLGAVTSRLAERLPEDHVHRYVARWRGERTSEEDSPISLDHLGALVEDAYDALSRVILDEIEQIDRLDPLDREIGDQEAFEEDRARLFTGRDATLAAIDDYVGGTARHPLALHGVSGSGKSAVLARAARLARDRASVGSAGPEPEGVVGPVVISRYIGATPASSDVRSLLESLSRQVARAYGSEAGEVPSDYRELVRHFRERLGDASADRPLILFIDALDQLSEADGGKSLIWLPAELPDHARIVVSTLPGDTRDILVRKLPPEALVELEPMPRDEASLLLDRWLAEAGRALRPEQLALMLERFEGCPYPLYLRLAFEEARLWSSYAPPSETALAADIPGLIRQLFARLSDPSNHGEVLTRHALGFLAAARNGLTEDEVLDLLSGDDERPSAVWDDFRRRARHTPPQRRLPVAVWSRLYLDLEPYLTERSADGTSLLSFYHRQLREVVKEDMLAGPEGAARHAALARYFDGQPLFLDGREPPSRDTERPPGIGVDETRAPNVRKLSELPFQQTRAAQLVSEHPIEEENADELWKSLYDTLTDFDFLEAKCSYVAVSTEGTGDDARQVYGGVYELQEDYRRALEVFPDELDRKLDPSAPQV